MRWRLRINRAEKTALLRAAGHCADTTITVRQARIATGTSTGTGDSTGGLDPRFGTCAEAKAKANGHGPYYQGRDPEYEWHADADHDGVVCE